MILGFLIFSDLGFIIFEHYFENFTKYSTKIDFFNFVEETAYKLGIHEMGALSLSIRRLNEHTSVGAIYLKNKKPNESIMNKFSEIALAVSLAEKETTHQVLKARHFTELL